MLAHETALAAHISRTGTLQLDAPMDRVFPLFDPVKESLWATGWSIQVLHPADGSVCEGMKFITPGHNGRTAAWVLVDLQPQEHWIRYARVLPECHAGTIEIRCRSLNQNLTEAAVTYSLVALSGEGERYLAAEFSEERYRHRLAEWQRAIHHYFQTGRPPDHFDE